VGPRYLADALETMGTCADSLKFAGGSFCLMPEEPVRSLDTIEVLSGFVLAPADDLCGLARRALDRGLRVKTGA
jgi:phosphosulfolactate synthase (CoM biosynthesis protein A)